MRIACGSERPFMTRNSSTLSKVAVSLSPSRVTGSTLRRSSPRASERHSASRARIQLMLPRSVLISPLCATYRYGCASGQDGKVLVLNRWCTRASADSTSGSVRSGNIAVIWSALSMPL